MSTGAGRAVMDGPQLGREAMRRLRLWGVCAIAPGLSDDELRSIEDEFRFQFALDHRAFLAAGLPINEARPTPPAGVTDTHREPWPDWRNGDRAQLRSTLSWPAEGVVFDVERNGFWYPAWGERPTDPAAARTVAAAMLVQVPTMIPVYGHRYLPGARGTFGHPVLSMWQTDIIYYGADLADYIDREFGRPAADRPEPTATVEFWRDLV